MVPQISARVATSVADALVRAGMTEPELRYLRHNPEQAYRMVIGSRNTTPTEAYEWYKPPEEQLAIMQRLNYLRGWGLPTDKFPGPPQNFAFMKGEIPLLTVGLPAQYGLNAETRTFGELWEAVTPNGFQKESFEAALQRGKCDGVVAAPGCHHRTGVRWVAYDPYKDFIKPKHAIEEGFAIPGTEVLSSFLVFPGRIRSIKEHDMDRPSPEIRGLCGKSAKSRQQSRMPHPRIGHVYESIGLELCHRFGPGFLYSTYDGIYWASGSIREIPA